MYIWCIITFRSRFSHDALKALIFDALLWGKAGFLVTRQKSANLLHYYLEKQVFSWRTKNSYIWSINSWKSSFSRDATENKRYIWCIIMFCSRFSHDAPKILIFDTLLRRKAVFLMTRQKLLYLMHYYVIKQIFVMTRQKVQICCIITFWSRFSHDAPKIHVMHYCVEKQVFSWRNRKQSVYLMYYYFSKQVFSWRYKNSYI